MTKINRLEVFKIKYLRKLKSQKQVRDMKNQKLKSLHLKKVIY